MSKIALILFSTSVIFQLFFSLYYSRNTFNANNHFQKLNSKITNLNIENNLLLIQIATISATTKIPTSTSSAQFIDLRHEP